MKKMFDHEVDRIRRDFQEVCRTFLRIYAVASQSDMAWETSENHTNELLWRKIGQLERRLEAVAPGTGPRYDRSDPIERSLFVIAKWCGIDQVEEKAIAAVPRRVEFLHNVD